MMEQAQRSRRMAAQESQIKKYSRRLVMQVFLRNFVNFFLVIGRNCNM